MYTQTEGSGFHLQPSEVKELPFEEIKFYLEWLSNQRQKEAEALKAG